MTDQRFEKRARRSFLKLAGGSLLATMVNTNSAWQRAFGFSTRMQLSPNASRVYLHAFNPASTTTTEAVQIAMLSATDLGWLKNGDSVFVKVASNSNYSPPSVTSPAALSGVIGLLKMAGAGTVYVGDMSGALFVRHLATETIGSTRANMRQNGLLAAAEEAGAVIHCFEEVPFAEGYIAGVPAGQHHWGGDLQVAEILNRVDHIVNLPRLGKHVLAGASLGLKNAVGWISDHSRMVLHRDADTFHEKIAEINAIPQLVEKTRLTLTLVDQALTTYGPDNGYHLALDQPLIVASNDIVSHDQIALLTLLWARQHTPRAALAEDPYPTESNQSNWWFVRVTWGAEAAAGYQDLHTFADIADVNTPNHVNYAYDFIRGGRPDAIEVIASGLALPDDLISVLTRYPDLNVVVPNVN